MPDPITLADVRAHIERRIRECSDEERKWDRCGSGDISWFAARAVRDDLAEILVMFDRVDQGPICKVMTNEKGGGMGNNPADAERKELAIEQLEKVLTMLREDRARCLLCTKEQHGQQTTITAPWNSWYITVETAPTVEAMHAYRTAEREYSAALSEFNDGLIGDVDETEAGHREMLRRGHRLDTAKERLAETQNAVDAALDAVTVTTEAAT
jgi:hypothetical protein